VPDAEESAKERDNTVVVLQPKYYLVILGMNMILKTLVPSRDSQKTWKIIVEYMFHHHTVRGGATCGLLLSFEKRSSF